MQEFPTELGITAYPKNGAALYRGHVPYCCLRESARPKSNWLRMSASFHEQKFRLRHCQ
jgi:hypothetical protein